MSSSPNPENLMKAAISKRNKAKEELDKATKYLDRIKGSSVQSASKASHERRFAQATSAFQQAEEEIRKLEMAKRTQEPPEAVEQPNLDPEQALSTTGLATAGLAPSTSVHGQSELSSTTGLEFITELRQELATVREDLNREKAGRELENNERDRQFAAVQEAFTKFLATVESEKKGREERYEQDLSAYKQTLRDDYKEAVKEVQMQARGDIQAIQRQAREDREEDMSTHTSLLGQIKTFQSDMAIFKKSIASFESDNAKHRKTISSLETYGRGDRADYRRLDKDMIALEYKKTLDPELAEIKRNISTLQEENKDSRSDTNATPLQPDTDYRSRLASLEAFEDSATEILNSMGNDLTKAKNDLDVMQDACSRVAFDAAKEEAEAVSTRLTSRIDVIENRVVPGDNIEAISLRLTSRLDAVENHVMSFDDVRAISAKLTSRIDAIENKIISDEDVKARLTTCESELTKVVKWVGQRPEDDPDEKTLTGIISTLELDFVGSPDQDDGILSIVARCEEAVRQCELTVGKAVRQCEHTVEATVSDLNKKIDDAVAELSKTRPENEDLGDHRAQAEINDKVSSLESKIESQRSILEVQVKTKLALDHSVNSLEQRLDNTVTDLRSEMHVLNSQLLLLQTEVQQEQAARKEVEDRVTALGSSSFASNNASLRAEIDAVKLSVLSTVDKTNQVFKRLQHLSPEGIQSDFKTICDRTYVLEGAMRNLETRYNAITTTSLVQMMLDQIYKLLPPDKDFVTVIRDAGQHSDQIRAMRQELNDLSNNLSLNNNAGIDDAASLVQNLDEYKQIVVEHGKKMKGMESYQQDMLKKLDALQFQLGLDGDKLYSNDALRESMENSMKELHMGHEKSQLAVSSITQSRIPENDFKDLQETVEGIDADLALVKGEQGKLEARLKVQEEEASKAATVSLSDPTRVVKKQHLDELKHTVQQHGLRIDKLEANTKNTTAGANDSNTDTDFGSEDTPPSVPRRNPFVPASHIINRDKLKSLGKKKKK